MSEEYKQVDIPTGVTLLPCPFCGSEAELNEFHDGTGYVTKVASCTNSGNMGNTDECILYFPSQVAHKATKREAIAVWNTRQPASNRSE